MTIPYSRHSTATQLNEQALVQTAREHIKASEADTPAEPTAPIEVAPAANQDGASETAQEAQKVTDGDEQPMDVDAALAIKIDPKAEAEEAERKKREMRRRRGERLVAVMGGEQVVEAATESATAV
jgi:hypothetical protein